MSHDTTIETRQGIETRTGIETRKRRSLRVPVTFALVTLLGLAFGTADTSAAPNDPRLETVAHAPGSGVTRRPALRERAAGAQGLSRRIGRRPQRADGQREIPEHFLELGKIFGDDDREPVDDTEAYPWAAVAKTFSHFPNGEWIEGSAAMVGPDQALTAGHIVYDHDRGGWADEVQVVPGFDLGFEPFGTFFADDLRSLAGWTEQADFDFDIALIELDDDAGDLTGWFGIASRSRQELLDGLLNTAGYPADLDDGEGMWFASDFALDVDDRTISMDRFLDAAGGQSGSGVWLKEGDDRVIVGVLSSETNTANVAVRIADDVFDVLDAWLAGPAVLSVNDVSTDLPVEVTGGASGTVFVEVTNSGSGDVVTTVRVYAEPVVGSTLLIGEAAVDLLSAETREIGVAVTIPDSAEGTYDIFATINDDGALDEADESDNELLGPELIVTEPWADAVSGESIRGRLVPGEVAFVRVTVPAGARKLKLRLRGLFGGFASVQKPNGSVSSLFPGSRKKRKIKFPQEGVWLIRIVNSPNSRRDRTYRFKAVIK